MSEQKLSISFANDVEYNVEKHKKFALRRICEEKKAPRDDIIAPYNANIDARVQRMRDEKAALLTHFENRDTTMEMFEDSVESDEKYLGFSHNINCTIECYKKNKEKKWNRCALITNSALDATRLYDECPELFQNQKDFCILLEYNLTSNLELFKKIFDNGNANDDACRAIALNPAVDYAKFVKFCEKEHIILDKNFYKNNKEHLCEFVLGKLNIPEKIKMMMKMDLAKTSGNYWNDACMNIKAHDFAIARFMNQRRQDITAWPNKNGFRWNPAAYIIAERKHKQECIVAVMFEHHTPLPTVIIRYIMSF